MSVSGAHIVVLNDKPDLLELYRDLLADEGYRVTTGEKLYETVDDLVALAPDLVILDFLWPGDRTGWDFLQEMRRDDRLTALPVIVCSGAGPALQQRADGLTALGAKILAKPFDLEELLGAVAGLLAAAPR